MPVAIGAVHRAAGFNDASTSESVRAVLQVVRRTYGVPPVGKSALRLEDLRRIDE